MSNQAFERQNVTMDDAKVVKEADSEEGRL